MKSKAPKPAPLPVSTPWNVIRVPFLKVNGMALFPFILIREGRPSARLINHERIHHRQQIELLIIPFYLWYLLEYLLNRLRGQDHYTAYVNIRFEREAYRHDADLDYLKKRKFWAFLDQ
ncbi:MAG: hypothetical protein LH606_20495 [Cytophagaceae bacterium]|nr:hypothetical protein [Cytophagaceae bacterium]